MYFEGCAGVFVGAGDDGSGVGESEEIVDGEGESSRERLGIANANVAVRVTLIISRPTRYPMTLHHFPRRLRRKYSVFECDNYIASDWAFQQLGEVTLGHKIRS